MISNEVQLYKYVGGDPSQPIDSIWLLDITSAFPVWRNEMQSRAKIVDYLHALTSVSVLWESRRAPSSPSMSASNSTPDVFDFVRNIQSSFSLLHCLVRLTILCGMLVVVGLLDIPPFGMSWTFGALLTVLIGSMLEFSVAARVSTPIGLETCEALSTRSLTQAHTPGAVEG